MGRMAGALRGQVWSLSCFLEEYEDKLLGGWKGGRIMRELKRVARGADYKNTNQRQAQRLDPTTNK